NLAGRHGVLELEDDAVEAAVLVRVSADAHVLEQCRLGRRVGHGVDRHRVAAEGRAGGRAGRRGLGRAGGRFFGRRGRGGRRRRGAGGSCRCWVLVVIAVAGEGERGSEEQRGEDQQSF